MKIRKLKLMCQKHLKFEDKDKQDLQEFRIALKFKKFPFPKHIKATIVKAEDLASSAVSRKKDAGVKSNKK